MSRPSPSMPHRTGPPGAVIGLLCLVAGGVGGSLVALGASTRPGVRVPDVIGVTRQDAQHRMRDAGLYRLDERDTAPGRLTTGQSPPAGTTVPPDTPITLFFGR
ncbi:MULTISPECIES: PASTA domain-containing protein [Thermomonosporaceae]|uniref:PASTA domain-containing protein n=1 Tax=Thermomonosporaceae TaxID=2012 RepID=UPI00255ABF48|nr:MULTISPECIES: PASTA domain-containing protein [Thermomonosporaceae]MDL4777604.1 PASTA domain-containing protein [Actinomadura xylanilytica]